MRAHPSLKHVHRILTGDSACEVHTGSLQYFDNNMLSYSHINEAFGNGGAANVKLPLLPLKSISSADLLRFLRI